MANQNVLDVTYNVMNETEMDTAFLNEEDFDSDNENIRKTNDHSILNYSPISVELTAANSSYFIKDNLSEADQKLDSISTLKNNNTEQTITTTTTTKKSSFQRSNSIRKTCSKVYKSIIKPLLTKRSTTKTVDTSEELSTISGLQYTSNTPSITHVTFDNSNNIQFNREYEIIERFQKARLSSTKYENVKRIQNRVNKPLVDNESSLRKFNNFGDFEVWNI
jgi:hypothetical protein